MNNFRTYSSIFGEHRFDENDNYLGYFDSNGVKQEVGEPFVKWQKWDKGKHIYLVNKLEFNYK